jgi:hypothetical protein
MNDVKIDSADVDRLLDNLSDTDLLNKILFDAVKSGAKVLRDKTKQSFRSEMGGVASNVSRFTRKPFEDGITMKSDKTYSEAKVSIMSDPRLKWFETGTQDRYTKGRKIVGYSGTKRNRLEREGKGHWTGRIKENSFFRKARSSSESAIDDAIIQSINNALKKLDR